MSYSRVRLQDQAVMTAPPALSSTVRLFQRKERPDSFHPRSSELYSDLRSAMPQNLEARHQFRCHTMCKRCPHWQAPRASSYPKRGIPAPNVYNLQRSFTDRCDFSVGASRVFRLPVGVQLDRSNHITPAPNHYNVCILKLLHCPSDFKC